MISFQKKKNERQIDLILVRIQQQKKKKHICSFRITLCMWKKKKWSVYMIR